MGYIKYRTMVYAFQDTIIPLMFDTLMPFFYKVEESIKLSELS